MMIPAGCGKHGDDSLLSAYYELCSVPTWNGNSTHDLDLHDPQVEAAKNHLQSCSACRKRADYLLGRRTALQALGRNPAAVPA